jgi:hypothetical protein
MMSKTKVPIVLTLVALAALGIGWVREYLPPVTAAGQTQSLSNDTLFFVSGPRPSIQRVSATEPGQLDGQTASAAVESFEISAAICELSGLHGAPNGHWIAVDVNCEAGSHTMLLEAATGQMRPAEPEPWKESFFLNWTHDGDSFLLRVDPIGDDLVLLVDARSGRFERLDAPPFTYDAALSPDGQRVLYAVSRGLGLGSEVWMMDQAGREKARVIHDPAHIIAYPRWSPTGSAIAYIRMTDSNVPFSVGELVVANGNGHNGRSVALADAGHGYPPVWSPDGTQVAFVVRENPKNPAADIAAPYLESNIHLVDIASGRARAVTGFVGALTDAPTWSPDGARLTFSTNAAGVADVWIAKVANGEVHQVTLGAGARYPVWLPGEGRSSP